MQMCSDYHKGVILFRGTTLYMFFIFYYGFFRLFNERAPGDYRCPQQRRKCICHRKCRGNNIYCEFLLSFWVDCFLLGMCSWIRCSDIGDRLRSCPNYSWLLSSYRTTCYQCQLLQWLREGLAVVGFLKVIKIAATYGDIIRVFEPISVVHDNKYNSESVCKWFYWKKISIFSHFPSNGLKLNALVPKAL